MPPITQLQLITDAFVEAGIFSPGEPLAPEDSSFAQSKLSRLFDTWSAEDLFIFAQDFLGNPGIGSPNVPSGSPAVAPTYLLIPSTMPATIGQAFIVTKVAAASGIATYTANNTFQQGQNVSVGSIGTIGGVQFNQSNVLVLSATPTQFTTTCGAGTVAPTTVNGMAIYPGTYGDLFPNYPTFTQRPAKIENANIILNNVSPIVRVPLRIHNNEPDWWASVSVPNVLTTIPTDLYYNPQWPYGLIYLWPEPNTNYGLELQMWVNLADIASLTYQFTLPQAYRDAVTYSLAESLCPSYGRPLDPTLARMAQKSRGVVKTMNSVSLNIRTRDAGIPQGSHNRSYFNWLNGSTIGPRP